MADGFKNMTHLCAAYKRRTSNRKTFGLKGKGQIKTRHAIINEKKAGVAVLVLDKRDFETKTVKNRKRQRTLYNYKGANPRTYNNFKYLHVQYKST